MNEMSAEEIIRGLKRCEKCEYYPQDMLEEPCNSCEQTGSHFEEKRIVEVMRND